MSELKEVKDLAKKIDKEINAYGFTIDAQTQIIALLHKIKLLKAKP